jgi:hypothetical protein
MSHTTPSNPKPFWHQINLFFAFPFQRQPLIYGGMLALSSLLSWVLFFLPTVLVLPFVELGIMLAASRYGFKIIALGSRGLMRASKFPRELDEEWSSLPWKLFVVTLVQFFFAGWLARLSPVLGSLALLLVSFVFPATVMVLVQTCSVVQTLRPGLLWGTVRIVGWPYVALCFFLFLLSSGAQIALGLLQPLLRGWLALPLFNFAFIYFGWVMASLIGYVMYQHHADFGVDLAPDAGVDDAPADRRTPQQIAQQQMDTLVAQMVTEGDLEGALNLAYEEQRSRPDEVPAQRRYHNVLLLSDKTGTLLEHARRYIGLLLARQNISEALKVYRACRAKDESFVLDDAVATLALAQAEWRNAQAREAVALLSGFDKRFRGHASIPQAYELAARVMVQGFQRPDKARPILALLEARHPDSAATQEVRWLLRDTPLA